MTDYPSIVMKNVPDGDCPMWRVTATPVQISAPMTITVALRQQYGQQVVLPLCEKGKLFAEIASNTTLTPRVIKIIKALGYTVLVKNETPERL